MRRSDYVWILVASIAWITVFLFVEHSVNGSVFSGFPLDDSWIHAQFAHNIAEGHGFLFTGNVQTPGETSPLWALLIAGVFKIFGESHAIVEIRLLSMVSYVILGILVTNATFKMTQTRAVSIIAGLCTVFLSDILWAANAGMETAFFGVVVMGAFLSYLSDKEHLSIRTTILFGLAALTRPEGTVLFGFAVLETILRKGSTEHVSQWIKSVLSRLLHQWKALLVFLIVASPYTVFCWLTTGKPFPNTYYAKGGGMHIIQPVYAYIVYFYSVLISANPFIVAAALIGSYAIWKHPGTHKKKFVIYILLLFPLIGTFASATVLTRRYFIPFLPLLLPTAMIGVLLIHDRLKNLAFKKYAIALSALAILAYSTITNTIGIYPLHYMKGKEYSEAEFFSWNIHNINDQEVRAAKWVAANVKPEEVVAVNDVGAMGYLSQHNLIDVCGLVSNDVMDIYKQYGQFDRAQKHVLDYLIQTKKPDYVIIYENWFPTWVRRLPVADSLEFIPENNITCGGDTMTVMKMDWMQLRDSTGNGDITQDHNSQRHF